MTRFFGPGVFRSRKDNKRQETTYVRMMENTGYFFSSLGGMVPSSRSHKNVLTPNAFSG